MKLLNKQIDMISWTSSEGIVTPIRFRMEENGRLIIIKIGRSNALLSLQQHHPWNRKNLRIDIQLRQPEMAAEKNMKKSGRLVFRTFSYFYCIIPQAIFLPEFPEGCVVKSSGLS